jgi:hypothetical protein
MVERGHAFALHLGSRVLCVGDSLVRGGGARREPGDSLAASCFARTFTVGRARSDTRRLDRFAERDHLFGLCTPTDMDQKGAQGAFVAGQGSFNEADYSTAILYWKDAYRRDCTAHALLLNLARAYELKGEKGEAIRALETYLQRRPNDPNVDQIQRRIQNLKTQLAAEQVSAPAPSLPPSGPVSIVPPAAPVSPSSEVSPERGGHGIAPWIVVGAGGVLTIVGIAVFADGKSKTNEVERICGGRACNDPSIADPKGLEAKGNDGVHEANLGGVLAWTGAAAVAAGLVWHFAFDKSARPKAATALTPVIGRGFAGVALDARF